MGMFDSFEFTNDGEQVEAQLKYGACVLENFEPGDEVHQYGYDDGIYYDRPYLIIIKNGVFVGGFRLSQIKDKRGFPAKIIEG